MSESADPVPAPAFAEAMDELEAILRRIEGEEIDIDRLAEELRRAAELLELCRAKIRRAEVEVTQIVQDLEEGAPAEEPPAGDPQVAAGAGGEAATDDEDDDDDLPF